MTPKCSSGKLAVMLDWGYLLEGHRGAPHQQRSEQDGQEGPLQL